MSVRCSIMVVEDEALIALDLAMTLEEMGADVCGPFGTVAAALCCCEGVDAAVLDVDLHGELVFPVADRLQASGTPFLFHTARADISCLLNRYGADTPVLAKPSREEHVRRGLISLLNRPGARHLQEKRSA